MQWILIWTSTGCQVVKFKSQSANVHSSPGNSWKWQLMAVWLIQAALFHSARPKMRQQHPPRVTWTWSRRAFGRRISCLRIAWIPRRQCRLCRHQRNTRLPPPACDPSDLASFPWEVNLQVFVVHVHLYMGRAPDSWHEGDHLVVRACHTCLQLGWFGSVSGAECGFTQNLPAQKPLLQKHSFCYQINLETFNWAHLVQC